MDDSEIREANIDEIGKCIKELATINYNNLPSKDRKILDLLSYLLPIKEKYPEIQDNQYSLDFKISLNKFIFMVHLLFYKHTGKHLTKLKFYRYKYGPYNSALLKNIQIDFNIIDLIPVDGLKDKLKIIIDDFDLLDSALKSYSANEWVEWSHKLEIFQGTPFGSEIKFETYDREELLSKIGYDYNEADEFAKKVISIDRFRVKYNRIIESLKSEY